MKEHLTDFLQEERLSEAERVVSNGSTHLGALWGKQSAPKQHSGEVLACWALTVEVCLNLPSDWHTDNTETGAQSGLQGAATSDLLLVS